MSTYKYQSDFNLGGIFLSDMGGVIYDTDDWKRTMNQLPEIEHSTDKDSVNDGERYIQSRYQTRQFENIPIIWKKDTDLAKVRAWLGSKEPQIFYWRDDEEHKQILAIYNKSIDFGGFYGDNNEYIGQMESISFIAHDPLWTIRGEYERKFNPANIGQDYLIKSNGNIKSSPIIRIKVPSTQATVQFIWNNSLTITLTNVLNEIYIDCDMGEVYEYKNGIKDYQMIKFTSNSNYDMPEIEPFVWNKIKLLSGSVSEIGVTINSKII